MRIKTISVAYKVTNKVEINIIIHCRIMNDRILSKISSFDRNDVGKLVRRKSWRAIFVNLTAFQCGKWRRCGFILFAEDGVLWKNCKLA